MMDTTARTANSSAANTLYLLFQLGKDGYALEVGQIAEVLPLVSIKKIPRSPPGVAGAFTYRGAPVPVIDLSELILGHPALERLSTRIIIVHYPQEHGDTRLLALIAEHAMQTIRRKPADFVSCGVTNAAAPYLGNVVREPRGLVQFIEVKKLLPASLRDLLFKTPMER